MFSPGLILLLLFNFHQKVFSQTSYTVVARRVSNLSVISKSSGSSWDFNYNAAIFNMNGQLGLLVRCQNLVNSSIPFNVGPSNIAVSNVSFDSNGNPSFTQPTMTTFVPNDTTEKAGVEDPRIAVSGSNFFMTYTAYNGTADIGAKLNAASSQNPMNVSSWNRLGVLLTGRNWSKSGALLFADSTNNLTQDYLFWGDSSSPPGGIGIATSPIGSFNWNELNNGTARLLQIRTDSFDSELVESGPAPIRLKTGDFLFVYNSARKGYPSVKPNWELQYNLGYAILSKSDPTAIVQRSSEPILSPVLDWEIGNTTAYLTPNVVFLEGLVPDPNGCQFVNLTDFGANSSSLNLQSECFFGVYGAADSVLGAARIVVTYTTSSTISLLSRSFSSLIPLFISKLYFNP